MKSGKVFLAILSKNIRLLLRSKSDLVIILLGPLIVVTLVGVAFSNSQNQFALSVGVYSEKYSELTNSLVQKLAQKFTVYQFESVVECVKYVRRGKVNICVEFPPDLDIKKDGGSSEITFYLDFSRVNVVWIVLDTLTERVSEKSTEISKDLTQILLTKLSDVHNESVTDLGILNTVILRQGNISFKLAEVYSDLSSVDLTVDSDEFKSSQIKSSAEKINNLSQGIIEESIDMIFDLEDIIGDMNCSTISLANNRMNTALKNISEMAEELNETYGKEDNDTIENSFLYYIELMSEKVNETQSQLGLVSDVKNRITADSYVKKALKEHSEDFLLLNNSMADVESKITSIEIRDASTIVNPITTKIQPVTIEGSYFNFLLPT